MEQNVIFDRFGHNRVLFRNIAVPRAGEDVILDNKTYIVAQLPFGVRHYPEGLKDTPMTDGYDKPFVLITLLEK